MSAARRFAQIATSVPPRDPPMLFRRAVVLGGSVAGLMAARILSDHAEEVLIVERDDLAAIDVPDARMAADPAGAVHPRPGVPQGHQVHALLPSGQLQLDRFFPGFTAEAIAAGAVNPPPGTNRLWFDGRLRAQPPTAAATQGLICSRPFLEALIRNRVLARPGVRAVTGRAEGITVAGGVVTGVRYVAEGDAVATELPADFVVDATGRSTRLGDWLGEHGYPKPDLQRMGIRLNYATAFYRRTPNPEIWTSVSVGNPAPGKVARLAGFTPIEGDRWSMLVAGYDQDKPSRDADEYRQRCVEHFPPEFGRLATTAEPASEVHTYHQADSRRREFHTVRRFPARLVAAGDAVASFNPVYGQGMTAATLHASCLSAYLCGGPDLSRPARSYFADVKVIVDAAWQVSTAADLELPHVDGPYPRGYALNRRLSGLIFRASLRDATINERLGQVTMMLAHPSALAAPRMIWRALTVGVRG